jgi:two-component system, response regulator RegA
MPGTGSCNNAALWVYSLFVDSFDTREHRPPMSSCETAHHSASRQYEDGIVAPAKHVAGSRPPRHVLIAEPFSTSTWTLIHTLLGFGVEVASTSSVTDALKHIAAYMPDCILSELKFADGTGFEILEAAKLRAPHARVIIHTSWIDPRLAARCATLGAAEVIPWPIGESFLSEILLRGSGRAEEVGHLQHPNSVRAEHIGQVLNAAGGNISEAARALKMHRRTLQRYLIRNAMAN